MSDNAWERVEHFIQNTSGGVVMFAAGTVLATTAICMTTGYQWDPAPVNADSIHAEFQENLNEIVAEKEDLNLVAQRADLAEQEMDLAIKRAELEGTAKEVIDADVEARSQAIEALYEDAADRADALEDASEDFVRDMLVNYQELGEKNVAELRDQFNESDLNAGRYALGDNGHDLSFTARALSSCDAEIAGNTHFKFNESAKAQAVVECASQNGSAEALKIFSFVPAAAASFFLLGGIASVAGRRGRYVRRREQSKKQKVGQN